MERVFRGGVAVRGEDGAGQEGGGWIPLPDTVDAVPVERPVEGDDGDVAHQGLRYEDAVERITVRAGKTPGAFGVRDGNRQFLEPLAGDGTATLRAKTSASASLPMRCLVAISQAEAALTMTALVSSAMDS